MTPPATIPRGDYGDGSHFTSGRMTAHPPADVVPHEGGPVRAQSGGVAGPGATRRGGTRRTGPACRRRDARAPLAERPTVPTTFAQGPSIPPAAAGERSERKPGRTWRAAAPPLCPNSFGERARVRNSNGT